jgi:uncharacterized membrane protein HdeD (DUF308 family)
MNWSITGFNPRRVAWIVAVLSLLLVPIHLYVPCEASARVMMFGVALLFLTGFLEMADRSGKKAGPFWLALVAVVAHILCTH